MKVEIIHFYPFPIGMAATNRIMAYSKGLVHCGCDVCVSCMNPCCDSKVLKNGTYQGVKYRYAVNPLKTRNAIFHKFRVLYSILYFIVRFACNTKRKKKDVLIISTENRRILSIFSFLAKIKKVKSIFIFDEYPSDIRYTSDSQIIDKVRNMYDKSLINVSGFISISELLAEFYNKDLNKKCLIFPSITDTSRFKSFGAPDRSSNLCYMGSLDLAKDNVELIIEAFALIANRYKYINFNIYGTPSKKDSEVLSNAIQRNNLETRVFLKGSVSFESVPEILSSSYILVSSQVDSPRIQAGLSTKLGEYLYSGTPVLLSDVGNLSRYVQDKEHLFFVEPNNVRAYAEKLELIINNYDLALKVARNGKKYIENNSSHIEMGRKMYKFLKQL